MLFAKIFLPKYLHKSKKSSTFAQILTERGKAFYKCKSLIY